MSIPYSICKKAIQAAGIRSSKEATELFVKKITEKLDEYAKKLSENVLSGKGKTANIDNVNTVFQ